MITTTGPAFRLNLLLVYFLCVPVCLAAGLDDCNYVGLVKTTSDPRYSQAVRFSEAAHAGREWLPGRNFSAHYDQVEEVLQAHGFGSGGTHRDWLLKTSARLHDVVEKTQISLDAIRAEFGDDVAKIVDGTTPVVPVDDKDSQQVKLAKEEYFKKTKQSKEAVLVKLADRVANFCSYLRDGIVPNRYMGNEHIEFEKALREPGEAAPLWNTLNFLVRHAQALADSTQVPPFSEMMN